MIGSTVMSSRNERFSVGDLIVLCRYIMASEKQKARTVSVESDDIAWRVKWRQIAEKYGLDRIKSQLVKVREIINYQTRGRQ